MNTIYSVLVSDGAIVLHFLLTMVLLVIVILRGIHSDMKLRRVVGENSDLRRQLSELSDFTSRSFHRVRCEASWQRAAVCHTADYLVGDVDRLDVGRFNRSESEPLRAEVSAESDFLTVDFVDDELAEPDLSMAESAFVEPDPRHLEPDVSMPLKASMITMQSATEEIPEEMREQTVGNTDETLSGTDVMTRVLQQSRGQ